MAGSCSQSTELNISQTGPGGGRSIKENNYIVNLADKAEEMLGGKGFTNIDGTLATTPPTGMCFCELHCISDTIISAYSVVAGAEIIGTAITGLTFIAGFVICGRFSSITLTSGQVFAYHGAL